jgi:hypothetical protein
VIDPFPERAGRGVVDGGRVRLIGENGIEIASKERSSTGAGGRWGDLELLEFAATALWTWVALPLAFDLGPGRHEVTTPPESLATPGVHALTVDADGRVIRHEDGDVVHHLSGQCDFGGVLVATRRRTRSRLGAPIGWADLVAAHVIPAAPSETLN